MALSWIGYSHPMGEIPWIAGDMPHAPLLVLSTSAISDVYSPSPEPFRLCCASEFCEDCKEPRSPEAQLRTCTLKSLELEQGFHHGNQKFFSTVWSSSNTRDPNQLNSQHGLFFVHFTLVASFTPCTFAGPSPNHETVNQDDLCCTAELFTWRTQFEAMGHKVRASQQVGHAPSLFGVQGLLQPHADDGPMPCFAHSAVPPGGHKFCKAQTQLWWHGDRYNLRLSAGNPSSPSHQLCQALHGKQGPAGSAPRRRSCQLQFKKWLEPFQMFTGYMIMLLNYEKFHLWRLVTYCYQYYIKLLPTY